MMVTSFKWFCCCCCQLMWSIICQHINFSSHEEKKRNWPHLHPSLEERTISLQQTKWAGPKKMCYLWYWKTKTHWSSKFLSTVERLSSSLGDSSLKSTDMIHVTLHSHLVTIKPLFLPQQFQNPSPPSSLFPHLAGSLGSGGSPDHLSWNMTDPSAGRGRWESSEPGVHSGRRIEVDLWINNQSLPYTMYILDLALIH